MLPDYSMPVLRPVRISTKGRNIWHKIKGWFAPRKWEIVQDWSCKIRDKRFFINEGFVFDGASIPRFFWFFLDPVGILLLPAILHDYGYKYAEYRFIADNKGGVLSRKFGKQEIDRLFLDACIQINGIYIASYIAYFAVKLFGFFAWNEHRRHEKVLPY